MRAYEHSYFREASSAWTENVRARAQWNRRAVEELAFSTFVSTPDLLVDVPAATWLPLTINVAGWATDRPTFESRVPTVLHIPSRRNPPIKGTRSIDAALTDLENRGAIRYLHPERVDHRRMPALVRSADVVVDQLMSGSYGVAAVEAMAAGRLVVGSVWGLTRMRIPDDVPILDTTPNDFRQTIEAVLDTPEEMQALAERGPVYAAAWHDGRAAATAIAPFLETNPGLGEAARTTR
jgi:hypothetical protein